MKTLHDIFPAVEIEDNSLYLFILLVTVLLFIFYLIYQRWYQVPKGIDYYLSLVEYSLQQNDAKKLAYQLKYYQPKIAKTPTQEAHLESFILTLRPFRYVQENTPLPLQIQKELEAFLKRLRQENV